VEDAVTAALVQAEAARAENVENVSAFVEIQVTLPANAPADAAAVTEVRVALPRAAVEVLTAADAEAQELCVRIVPPAGALLGTLELDQTALAAIPATGDLDVVLGRVSAEAAAENNLRLPAEDALAQVYEISLYARDNTMYQVPVTQFNGGRATVSFPYESKDGEQASGVTVWHVTDSDSTVVPSRYNEAARLVTFFTDHLSYYAVGYRAVTEPAEPPVSGKRPTPNGGSGAVLTQTPAETVPSAPVTVSYISGADRVLTSAAISRAGWQSADTVIIAPGGANNLIDALAVAPLAGQAGAPILLSVDGTLAPAVLAEIERLGATKVYAVGALSQSVIDALRAALPEVTVEVLRGADRFETAALVSAQVENPQGTFIVGYNALADAVSVASYAAAHGYLIRIAQPDGNVSDVSGGGPIYILGGPALVRDVPGAARLYGPDRYATNLAVRQALPFEYSRVYTADGATLVDALTGSALAAQSRAPIVLVPGNDPAGADLGNITTETEVFAFGAKK
jgi:hypothetical protein